jgi:hypothetical protein
VIHDVDESLRALAMRDALNGSRVEIAFDAPTREWAARQNAPTVSMYLYDIREDLQRREVAFEPVRGPDGIVTEHRSPARRFRLSYMITAWTQRPEDEHRLLAAMLGCFLRHAFMPPEFLVGSLVEMTAPILMTVALPPPPDRSLADVWSALGGELKPSLDLVVTAPMDAWVRIDAAPPVRELPQIRVVRPDGAVDEVGEPGSVAGGAARARPAGRAGPASPRDPADQEEVIVPGARAQADPVVQADKPTDEPGKGRRKSGAKPAEADRAKQQAPEQPEPAAVPGRRIIIRGLRKP